MTQTKCEPTKQILAIDQDGKHYKIIEHTTFLDNSEFGTSNKWKSGERNYKLKDGTSVIRRSDIDFEIISPAGTIKLRILP